MPDRHIPVHPIARIPLGGAGFGFSALFEDLEKKVSLILEQYLTVVGLLAGESTLVYEVMMVGIARQGCRFNQQINLTPFSLFNQQINLTPFSDTFFLFPDTFFLWPGELGPRRMTPFTAKRARFVELGLV